MKACESGQCQRATHREYRHSAHFINVTWNTFLSNQTPTSSSSSSSCIRTCVRRDNCRWGVMGKRDDNRERDQLVRCLALPQRVALETWWFVVITSRKGSCNCQQSSQSLQLHFDLSKYHWAERGQSKHIPLIWSLDFYSSHKKGIQAVLAL